MSALKFAKPHNDPKSVGDHIHATTFEHAWATPGHTATGGSQKSKE